MTGGRVLTVLPENIVMMATPFGQKLACTVCRAECFVADLDTAMTKTEHIEFNHVCNVIENVGQKQIDEPFAGREEGK